MSDRARARILQLRVNDTLKNMSQLNKSTVKSVIGDLRRARDDISLLMKSATRFDMPALKGLRDDINERINFFEKRIRDEVLKSQEIAFRSGAELTDGILKTAGVQFGMLMLSDELLSAAKELSGDLIKEMTDSMKADIAKSVRRSMLIGESPFDAARKLDTIIGTSKGRGYMNRSDLIARQEIGRTFSQARQAKDEMIAKQIPELKKMWRTAQDELVRPSPRYPWQTGQWNHREAHEQIRKVNEAFLVSGEELMYPRDSSGTLENILGCRCVSVPYMEGWE